MMPTVDWHRQLDIGHGFARANTSLAGPTGPWHNVNTISMDATCKQIATKLLLHLKQQSQKTRRKMSHKTLRKMLIKMESDSQLVGARDYKQLASVVKRIRLSWLQVPPYIYSL